MSDLIKLLISENTVLISKIYNQLGGLMTTNTKDIHLNEVAALLKINEIMLMELAAKTTYHNESKVIASLTLMKEILQKEIYRLDTSY